MSAATEGLRQIGAILNPRTLSRLRAAGMTNIKTPVALAKTLPWLLARGPSLGIVVTMNGITLGDKPAIHDRHGMLTWQGLDARTNRSAAMLLANEAAPRTSVATLLRNGREQSEVILGAQKVGVVATPLNTWAKPKELIGALEGIRPKVIVYDDRHAEPLMIALKELDAPQCVLVHVGDGDNALPDSRPYEELLAAESDRPPPPFTRQRGIANVVIHTSGTTGKPKGAPRNAAANGLSALADLLGTVPYKRDDVILCPSPLFHSFGLATFAFAIGLGATVVLPDKFDPEDALALVAEHRATAASMVPVMIRRVVALPDDVKKRYDVSSMRILLASGAVLSEDLRRAAAELFGDVLYDLYGSTEVGWVAIATPEDMRTRPMTVGKPLQGVDVAVFSPDGRRLPRGDTGALYIRSKIVFEGYTTGDSKDEREGYMAIGDLGRVDDDGYLYVESRTDDMVVVGGENVYPIEVEQVIEGIPGVEEVTVLGVPDDEYGNVLAAFVVGSVREDQVRDTCLSELASYKVPKRIEVVAELPRTSTGKVLKRELLLTINKGVGSNQKLDEPDILGRRKPDLQGKSTKR